MVLYFYFWLFIISRSTFNICFLLFQFMIASIFCQLLLLLLYFIGKVVVNYAGEKVFCTTVSSVHKLVLNNFESPFSGAHKMFLVCWMVSEESFSLSLIIIYQLLWASELFIYTFALLIILGWMSMPKNVLYIVDLFVLDTYYILCIIARITV